jgi:inosose dehydratase
MTVTPRHPPDSPPTSTRRQFFRTSTKALLLGTLAGSAGPWDRLLAANVPAENQSSGLVGSNIYGWGQYYQRDNKPLEVNEVMSALRDAGYDYLEGSLDANAPDSAGRLAEQMKAKGLKPVTIYTGARLHEAGKARQVVERLLTAAKVCHQAGFRAWSCNVDPIGREKTDDELMNQASALNDLGQGLKEIGIRLGIHHHLPEMASQAREFHYTFRHTDPSRVGFCYDVHWVYRGGVMPLTALRQYGGRLVSWHLRQSRAGTWWEDLDTGDVDYAEVARYAKEHRLARLFTVELALENGTKITRSVVENHRRSREFVRRVLGV